MPAKKYCVWVLFLLLAFGKASSVSAEKIEQIIAIVNGDIITDEELNMFIKMEAAANSGQPIDQKKVEEFKKDILERMIEDRLILQEAKAQQMKIDESAIEDRIKEIKLRAGSELAFEMALKSQGLSLSELREKLKNQLMIYMLMQKEVKGKVTVSPKEVTDYFQEHQDKFLTPETVIVDSIFVKDKETVDKVEAELGAGADFLETAKKYSEKTSLGEVSRGQVKEELENFIFSLDLGKYSKPFKNEDGYYVFLVKEKLTPSTKTIEEVKDNIKAQLEDEKTEKTLKEWIENLKDKAYISIRE